MSARAVAVIRPATSIIALPAFLCILSGKSQLPRLPGLSQVIANQIHRTLRLASGLRFRQVLVETIKATCFPGTKRAFINP